jgi:SAM-dependent methyltransferase
MLTTIVQQFGKPTGLLGEVAGLIMTFRPSTRERNERTLELLDIQPNDDVLEVGFGPGLGIEGAAKLARAGKVVGIDHSELMLRQASRRNAEAIAAGWVHLLLASAEQLPDFGFRPAGSCRGSCSTPTASIAEKGWDIRPRAVH